MGGAKPWQIVVIVLAVLAAGGSIIYSCSAMGDKVDQSSNVSLIDVKTGDLFESRYPDKRPVSYPAVRPDTHEAVLYPVYQSNNKWLISGRFLGDVKKDKALKPDLLVDAKTGEVKVNNAKPVRVDAFGK